MDVRDTFDATVELSGPDPTEWGYFLVRRGPDVEHEGFLRLVSNHVGGDEYVVLDSPGGVVIVNTPFGIAQELLRLPAVIHIGGVTIDPERFNRAFRSSP